MPSLTEIATVLEQIGAALRAAERGGIPPALELQVMPAMQQCHSALAALFTHGSPAHIDDLVLAFSHGTLHQILRTQLDQYPNHGLDPAQCAYLLQPQRNVPTAWLQQIYQARLRALHAAEVGDRSWSLLLRHTCARHGVRIKRAAYVAYGPAESATRTQLTCLSSAPGSKTVTPAEHLPTVVAQLQARTPSAQPVPVPRTADPIPERVQRVVEEHLRSIPTSEIGRPIPARELWDAYMKGIDQLPDMPLLMDAFTDALGDGWTVVGRENADDDWYEKPVVNNYAWHWTA